MKKVIALIAALILVLSLAACGNGTFTIDSPAGKLSYPSKWKSSLRTETTENSLAFYGNVKGKPEQHLFTLTFGESDGYVIGKLNGEYVHIEEGQAIFDDSWTDKEKETILQMQDDVNVIIDGLEKVEPINVPIESSEMIPVDTPIGTLAYSEKWADSLSYELTGNVMTFYGSVGSHERLPLYSLGFSEENGTLIGIVKGTPVYSEILPLDYDSSWTDDEKAAATELQDSINDLLQSITELEGFEPNV